MVFAAVAFGLNLYATLTCNFMERLVIEYSYSAAAYDDEGNVTHIDDDEQRSRWTYGLRRYECYARPSEFEDSLSFMHFGLYYDSQLTDDEVNEEPFNPFTDPDHSEQTDSKFRAAMACACFGVLVGGMVSIFAWLGTCFAYHKVARIAMGCVFGLASLFAFMTLVVFSADMCESDVCLDDYRDQNRVNELDLEVPLDNICNDGCRVGPGAAFAIVAGFFWLIAAVVNCFLMDAPDDEVTCKTPATTETMTRQLEEERKALNPVEAKAFSATEEVEEIDDAQFKNPNHPQAGHDAHHEQEQAHPRTPPKRSKKKKTHGAHDSDEGLPPVSPGRIHHEHQNYEETNIENKSF